MGLRTDLHTAETEAKQASRKVDLLCDALRKWGDDPAAILAAAAEADTDNDEGYVEEDPAIEIQLPIAEGVAAEVPFTHAEKRDRDWDTIHWPIKDARALAARALDPNSDEYKLATAVIDQERAKRGSFKAFDTTPADDTTPVADAAAAAAAEHGPLTGVKRASTVRRRTAKEPAAN